MNKGETEQAVDGALEESPRPARPRRRFHLRQAAVHQHPSQAPQITHALGQAVRGVFSVTFPDPVASTHLTLPTAADV